jgi:hypothetical protein
MALSRRENISGIKIDGVEWRSTFDDLPEVTT